MKFQSLVLVVGIICAGFGFAGTGNKVDESRAKKLFARATPDDYMNQEACGECHADIAKQFPASPHAPFVSDGKLPLDKQGCQACHGPGHIHQADENAEVISYKSWNVKESSAACLRCHEKTMSPSHWKKTEHAQAGVGCVTCHQVHVNSEGTLGHGAVKKDPRKALFVARKEPKAMLKADEATLCGSCHPSSVAQFRGASHHPIPEGRMVCSDCHNTHPSKNEKVGKDAYKNKCVTCHTDKAGPFIYEHDPVAGFTGNGCEECHRPHGTNNPKMLNSVTRGLCGQCHTDKMANHYPGQTCWSAGCHVASHGSNSHPRFLQR